MLHDLITWNTFSEHCGHVKKRIGIRFFVTSLNSEVSNKILHIPEQLSTNFKDNKLRQLIPKKFRRSTSFHTQYTIAIGFPSTFTIILGQWQVFGSFKSAQLRHKWCLNNLSSTILKTVQIQTWTWTLCCWLYFRFFGNRNFYLRKNSNCPNIPPLSFVCKCTCRVDNALSRLFHDSLIVTCTQRRLKQEGHSRFTLNNMERAYLSLCTFLMLIWLSVQQKRGYIEYFFPIWQALWRKGPDNFEVLSFQQYSFLSYPYRNDGQSAK